MNKGDTSQSRGFAAILIFSFGLVVWLTVQGVLTLSPLQNWALLPEPDDTLTYLLKTKQLEECFSQDCLALQDLRAQLFLPAADPEVAAQRSLATSRLFPVYHPLFSLLLLLLTKLGWDLFGAYRLIWELGPVLFGAAFGYLLTTLYGLPVAGVALILLAFKVFPDTGLHHLVPSNLAMAVAVVVWARIIAQRGKAPWTIIIGALILVGLHPIGRLYAVMAVAFALAFSQSWRERRVWLYAAATLIIVLLAFVLTCWWKGPALVNPGIFSLHGISLAEMGWGVIQSLLEVTLEFMRLGGGLFGSWPIFCGAVVLGLAVLPGTQRALIIKITVVYFAFIILGLGYVSSHPGDLFFRMWIPLSVILNGLVAQAFCYALAESWRLGRNWGDPVVWPKFWPVLALAVLVGYAGQMITSGSEQVLTYSRYLRDREPVTFSESQPHLLLSRARPGDRVFYNSIMIMPYYFIFGAMRLGAVYYPALQGTPAARRWLERPDLRFAVTYNPTMYHPAFAGRTEDNWWIPQPSFRYSPLDKSRKQGPLAREGKIFTRDFRWIAIAGKFSGIPKNFRIKVYNPGRKSQIELLPVDGQGQVLDRPGVRQAIPAGWSGVVTLGLKDLADPTRFRMVFPTGAGQYEIHGFVFDASQLSWPWAQKAKVTFQPREDYAPITVCFDPEVILPPPLNKFPISVLDDGGSSVLFQIHR